MTQSNTLVADSLASTREIGDRLARAIQSLLPLEFPLVICLDGNLGAGKTTFATSLGQALGVAGEDISSPTFSLQNVYQYEFGGRLHRINHFDFYRINDEDELFETGFEETVSRNELHIVEWASRFPECLPEGKFLVKIIAKGESERLFQFENLIKELDQVLESQLFS